MTTKDLQKALSSPDAQKRNAVMLQFSKTDFGIDALPLLRQALNDTFVSVALRAAECIGQLGPRPRGAGVG
jgi:hypothetical protein